MSDFSSLTAMERIGLLDSESHVRRGVGWAFEQRSFCFHSYPTEICLLLHIWRVGNGNGIVHTGVHVMWNIYYTAKERIGHRMEDD